MIAMHDIEQQQKKTFLFDHHFAQSGHPMRLSFFFFSLRFIVIEVA